MVTPESFPPAKRNGLFEAKRIVIYETEKNDLFQLERYRVEDLHQHYGWLKRNIGELNDPSGGIQPRLLADLSCRTEALVENWQLGAARLHAAFTAFDALSRVYGPLEAAGKLAESIEDGRSEFGRMLDEPALEQIADEESRQQYLKAFEHEWLERFSP